MQLDNTSIVIFVFSVIYWLYLVDPFKGKPQARNYKKILHNRAVRVVNFVISLILMLAGLLRIILHHQPDFLALVPVLFIVLVLLINASSQKLFERDFHLIIRGDTLKSSAFDVIASMVAIALPWVLSLILVFGFLTN